MTAYALYEPVNTLKPVADDVWIVDGPEIRMTYPWLPFFKVPFPTRMTVVRLGDGGLWLHSPTPLTDALAAAVDSLGRVAHLVAPNLLHFWWIGDWKARYRQARAYAAPGVRAHAAQHFSGFDEDLTDSPPQAWHGEFEQVLVPGSYMTEAVFFHRASRTLDSHRPDREFRAGAVFQDLAAARLPVVRLLRPGRPGAGRPAFHFPAPPRRGSPGGRAHAGMGAGAGDSGAWQVVPRKRHGRVETRLPLGFMTSA